MRTGLIDPSIIADDDRLRKRLATVRGSRHHRLTDVAVEDFSPRHIDHAVVRRGNGGPAAHTRVVVDLVILGNRPTTVRRPGDERSGLLFSFPPVDPCEMQHAVRGDLHGIEGMLNDLLVVVDQCRWAERTSTVAGPAQSQLTRERLVGCHLGMGHRPGDKDVLSADDQGRRLLAIVGILAGLIDGDRSAQRAAGRFRSGKQNGPRLLVFLDPSG